MVRLLIGPAELVECWECTSTPHDAAASPAAIADAKWLPARVPGTFAAALRDAGAWDGRSPLELDHLDVWYRTRFRAGGEETLHFDGLATIADIWLNGERVHRSANMFLPCAVAVQTLAENELHLCFRSLAEWLRTQRGRARWRTRIATPSSLRFARTTLLGRMPGWCPTIHPVGPWRPVWRQRREAEPVVRGIEIHASVKDGDGRLSVCCTLAAPDGIDASVEIAGASAPLRRVSPQAFAGVVSLPDVSLWWPHTHGTPHLHQATLRLGGIKHDLGRVGFRTIEVDRGPDGRGFGLRVNGVPIFCRGACWTTPDIVTLPCDAASYRPWLQAMRDAGGNMVRVGGTMVYEGAEFYSLCDELGLLVWQDAMLANFDYPTSEEFRGSLTAELESFLRGTLHNASLAVFCGGSEVLQQAAMFGVDRESIDDSLYRKIIPLIVASIRPDLAYVSNSPSGGDLPFMPNSGVSHYYGVGAYCRPLDDARRAEVRFASECLALAHVPCAQTVAQLAVSTPTDPRWKQTVPRDPGVGWDFEDIRDFYLGKLFDADALHRRYADFAHYLELSRAVSCVLMQETFNEWRREGSTCRGGLVWQWQDVVPGAGWGVLDAFGRPKAAWYALRRAWRNRQLLITDEGLNGLVLHVINEADVPLRATLRMVSLKDGATSVREAERVIDLPPRSSMHVASGELLPAFFDITHAYRFGTRVHDVTIATLHDSDSGSLIADACHFPDIAAFHPGDIGLEAAVERAGDVWLLRLRTSRFGLFVHVDDAAYVPADNWLHLPPRDERRIRLLPCDNANVAPRGEVRALNMDRVVHYSGPT